MNRLQKLHQDLQATTKAKEVTNVHLANITGFSRPSISEAIRSGKINNRMNRVLDLVDLVIGAYDITSLWALAEKEKEEISWEDFVVKKVNHCFSVSGVLEENQLDIVDVYGRPETPEWLPLQLQGEAEKLSDDQLREVVMIGEISQQGAIGAFKELIKNSSELDAKAEGEKPKSYYGFTSPLALNMIESDIENGHISEDFNALVNQLKAMFGEQGHYEFKEVRAALVALECPEMVEKTPSSISYKESNLARLKELCDLHLCESILLQEQRHIIAEKLIEACSQLNIVGVEQGSEILLPLGKLISASETPISLMNIRLARWAISDSEAMKEWLPEEAA
ncbi:hypothetical protein [Vibrio lentus]|uniref:Uncharacterized protein n=1 Tax=Vibrio lentus TaxID=136468 RepID=A0A855ISJ1_9VIBR|nr:hypothetical protein [Vibrio lentus]PML25118.1 hypothetical protein BCT80_20350 [Vibrio lentus]PMM60657.1 hypothetical protein BCT50_22135 [Vibrio lentus]